MEKRNFDDLCRIMEKLRSPEGCAWDKEQTHLSLKRYLIEEAYEAAETFDSGNGEKMADELGDVLLQVVFHAQIGKENGEFDINDVTEAISKKMVERHPNVFGTKQLKTSAEVLANWDEIKRKERHQETISKEMEGVSLALPQLVRAEKLYKKARKAGFDEIPDDGSAGYKIFAAACSATDQGQEPEEELAKYLKKYMFFFKKFEETT